ncbi:MAG: hypothetical protein HXS44_06875 [Theionarchaea archaeon]|nr:hypothetical protein [Theionarchaea archaeon]
MEPINDCEGRSTGPSLRKKCENPEIPSLQKRKDRESQPGCACDFQQVVNRKWGNG